MIRYQFRLVILIIGMFLSCSSVVAEVSHSVNARITLIAGTVQVQSLPEKSVEKATLNQSISEKALLITEDKSLAIVTLPDGSQFKVNPNSKLSIDTLKAGGSTSPASTVLTLNAGSIFSKI